MTFTELVDELKDQLNLRRTDSATRLGRAVNARYKRVTSAIGLRSSRQATSITANTTIGSTLVTFALSKVERITDARSGSIRVLDEVLIDELLEENARTDDHPTRWALQLSAPDTVTVRTDALAQTQFELRADGLSPAGTLSGSMEPQFAEDFHDILIFGVLADEYRKAEKVKLAQEMEEMFERRLSDLRMFIAKSAYLEIKQGGANSTMFGGTSGSSGGGGSAPSGGTSYTQTGQITFDRDPSAPFVVTSGSAVVTNLDADKLDGQHGSYYNDAANLTGTLGALSGANLTALNATQLTTGTVPNGRFPATLPAASGVNLTALNATQLTSGTVPDARFPATLPAASGVNLTALNASNLASGTVAEARLGSGSGTVNKVLRGNNTWGDSPGITTDGANAVQQIAFAASQSASANANTLDDYEEGSWTPGLTPAAGSGLTVTSTGKYIKVGKQATVTADITVTALGTASGVIQINGLPFTVATTASVLWYAPISAWVVNTAQVFMAVAPISAATTCSLTTIAAASTNSTNALTVAVLGNSGILRFTVTYETAS